MKKIASKELIIGICVLCALVILFFGIDYLKGINLFQPTNFYYVNYDNVHGLETAAPVNIDGYKVGQVRDIEFNYENPGKIKVTLALDDDLKVPEDSHALIEESLLGGPSIVIKLGKSKKMIEVGGEIKGGMLPGMMSAVTDKIMPQVNNMLPQLDSLLYNLNQCSANLNVLSGSPALMSAVERLDEITLHVAAFAASLRSTMSHDVPMVMKNANAVLANLDSTTSNLMQLSAQLKQLPIDGTMDNVYQTTANLRHLSDQLNNTQSTLGMLLNDPELYNKLNRVTADIDSLIVDIQRNPKRYISIKLL